MTKSPVGMGLYYDCPEMEACDFSQIFIDRHYQGRGYGKAAIKIVLDAMKKDSKFSKVVLCYIEGNDGAKKLYEQLPRRSVDAAGNLTRMKGDRMKNTHRKPGYNV